MPHRKGYTAHSIDIDISTYTLAPSRSSSSGRAGMYASGFLLLLGEWVTAALAREVVGLWLGAKGHWGRYQGSKRPGAGVSEARGQASDGRGYRPRRELPRHLNDL